MAEDKYYFEGVFSKQDYHFSFNENRELIELILKNKKTGKVLDLGCGEGGNSIKLSSLGFDVTCVDISKTAIQKIREEAKKRKISLKAICEDISNYKINEYHDVVIMTGVFHFFPKRVALALLNNVKNKTRSSGLNILDVFLKGNSIEHTGGYFFKKNELKDIYSDWNIINYEEYEELNKEEGEIDKYLFLVAKKK